MKKASLDEWVYTLYFNVKKILRQFEKDKGFKMKLI